MVTSMSRPRARRVTALITLATLLSGCATWQTVRTPYETSVGQRTLEEARVSRADGRTDTLFDVTVTADSVIGYGARHFLALRTPIARSEVDGIEARHGPTAASAIVDVGGLALLGVFLYAMTQGSWFDDLGS